MTYSSSIRLPKGLIDYATFQRESGWSAAQIDHAIAHGHISAVQVGRTDIAFFLQEIPAASGSALLFDHLDEQVDLKRTELAEAKARRRRAREVRLTALMFDCAVAWLMGGGL